MERIVIFGASSSGRRICAVYKTRADVLYFTDNNESLWGSEIDGLPCKPTSELNKFDYDRVIIASLPGLKSIQRQLIEVFHIPESRIDSAESKSLEISRISFIESYA